MNTENGKKKVCRSKSVWIKDTLNVFTVISLTVQAFSHGTTLQLKSASL